MVIVDEFGRRFVRVLCSGGAGYMGHLWDEVIPEGEMHKYRFRVASRDGYEIPLTHASVREREWERIAAHVVAKRRGVEMAEKWRGQWWAGELALPAEEIQSVMNSLRSGRSACMVA